MLPALASTFATSNPSSAGHHPPAGTIVGISIAILIVLFSIQRFGTRGVGYAFSPVILLWFLFNAIIGMYNIAKFNPGVFRAISPSYWFSFFLRNGGAGWRALGGVVLCVTGGRLCCFRPPVLVMRVRALWGQRCCQALMLQGAVLHHRSGALLLLL